MKKILLFSLLLIILLNSIFLIKSENEENKKRITHYLFFNVILIKFKENWIKVEKLSDKALIKFDGNLYQAGNEILYKKGIYDLEAIIQNGYYFLFWLSSENIIIENRFNKTTKAILSEYNDKIILDIIDNYSTYSHITLVISDTFIIPFPITKPYIAVGNITLNDLSIYNKVNDINNTKFIPFESIKVKVNIKVNENKPATSSRTYGEKTIVEVVNYIINNGTLIKRENLTIKNAEILSWNYNETYNKLIDINKTYTIIYPDSNYGLGINDIQGNHIILSYSYVRIKWSWYELVNNLYVYREVEKKLIGINSTIITVSSILLTHIRTIYSENNITAELQFLWSDDFKNVKYKQGVLSLNVRFKNLIISETNHEGKINITFYNKAIYTPNIFDYLLIKPQFKNNGTIIYSYYSNLEIIKLATIIEEVIINNNYAYIKLRIVDFKYFNPVPNVLVKLYVNNETFEEITNKEGLVIFSINLVQNIHKIYVKVYPIITDKLYIASELSDILIFLDIYDN